jgi:transcriptional regulator with XRE-family HTH domain
MISRHETSPPTSDPLRREFCDHLRARREEKGLSLEEIANATRIPARSLRRLEAGRFEELPADVFVRGFLRSYARCVELDPEETISRYAVCGLEPAPVCSREAAALERQAALAAGEPVDGDDGPDAEEPEARLAAGASNASDDPAGSRRARMRTFLPPEHSSRSDGSRRGQLTLGVIILVIVATLAMSYLMRRPSDAGDGVTEAERAVRVLAA